MLQKGVNVAATTYADKAFVAVRVSKEFIPSQELLDQLLEKYMHEELDNFYMEVSSKVTFNIYYRDIMRLKIGIF